MNYWPNGVYTLPFQSQFAELPIFVVYSGVWLFYWFILFIIISIALNSLQNLWEVWYHIVRGDNFFSWLKQPRDAGSCPVRYSTEAYLLHKASVMLLLFVKHIWQAGNDPRHTNYKARLADVISTMPRCICCVSKSFGSVCKSKEFFIVWKQQSAEVFLILGRHETENVLMHRAIRELALWLLLL